MAANISPRQPSKQHLPALDGIRAIAVLIVIVFHFWEAEGLGAAWANRLAPWGQTGVDLFFVLSGFLITGILLDSRGSRNFLRNFYARRMLRIFPLYYAVLLSVLVIGPALHLNAPTPPSQSWWFWVYLQNLPITFRMENPAALRHFWTLAVEEHYYLIWPLLVMRYSNRTLLKLTGVAVLISLLTRVVFAHYSTFVFTPARLDGLGIGSAIAILQRSSPDGLARLVPRVKYLFAALAAALIVSNAILGGKGVWTVQIVKSTLIAFAYGCGILLAVEQALGQIGARFLSNSVLGSIGKYSYAMYVLHPFVQGFFASFYLSLNIGLRVLMVIAGSYVAARISWILLERHFLRLKRYFEYSAPVAVHNHRLI